MLLLWPPVLPVVPQPFCEDLLTIGQEDGEGGSWHLRFLFSAKLQIYSLTILGRQNFDLLPFIPINQSRFQSSHFIGIAMNKYLDKRHSKKYLSQRDLDEIQEGYSREDTYNMRRHQDIQEAACLLEVRMCREGNIVDGQLQGHNLARGCCDFCRFRHNMLFFWYIGRE